MDCEYKENWNNFFTSLIEKCPTFDNLELIDPSDFHFFSKFQMPSEEINNFLNIKSDQPPANIQYCSKNFGYLRTVDNEYYIYVNYQSESAKKPVIIVNFLSDDVFCIVLTSAQELRISLNNFVTAVSESADVIE
ncbi:hypothetical protein DMUE_4693 [Dictyocoela muelleri]|nr:hypothetical protein DMUE_4693 [Dictyocoela muelleri]